MGALIFLYLYLCCFIVTIYVLVDMALFLITGDLDITDDGEEE